MTARRQPSHAELMDAIGTRVSYRLFYGAATLLGIMLGGLGAFAMWNAQELSKHRDTSHGSVENARRIDELADQVHMQRAEMGRAHERIGDQIGSVRSGMDTVIGLLRARGDSVSNSPVDGRQGG